MKDKVIVLLKALEECLPDLQHYAATHGPGPDRRLAALQNAVAEVKKSTMFWP